MSRLAAAPSRHHHRRSVGPFQVRRPIPLPAVTDRATRLRRRSSRRGPKIREGCRRWHQSAGIGSWIAALTISPHATPWVASEDIEGGELLSHAHALADHEQPGGLPLGEVPPRTPQSLVLSPTTERRMSLSEPTPGVGAAVPRDTPVHVACCDVGASRATGPRSAAPQRTRVHPSLPTQLNRAQVVPDSRFDALAPP